MHEHIVTRSPGVHENWPHLFDRPGILASAERKMADLYARGIRTIVDLTTVDLGRDIELIVDGARRSRVQVIVAAGVWWMPQRLSHDANCSTDLLSEEEKRRTRPRWHYNHISDDILPALRAAGVTEDQIDQMLMRNPRAIFEASGL